MGKVIGAFGVHGFVKIKTDSVAVSESLNRYNELYLFIYNHWTSYKVEKAHIQDSILNVKLSNVSDRTAAIKLKGALVAVPRDTFPRLNADEYYWVDLVGCNVYNKNNEDLGVITNLMSSGSNSVLTVTGLKQHLIPFIGIYVLEVNLAQKKIIVDWGLDY